MLDVCCIVKSSDEYLAVIKGGNERQLQGNMLLSSNLCYGGLFAENCCSSEVSPGVA